MFRFLLFRRHLDPALLSIAMASLVVKLGPEILIFGFFAGVGIYLILGMHRSRRYIDGTYALSAGILAAGAVVIGLIHGEFAEEVRWIAYPVILLLGVFLFPGVILIKDPLRQLVLGARAGLVLALAIGGVEIVSGLLRIGFGGNAANAAFVIVVVGVLARMQVQDPWRFLPNSRLWFYAAAVAVVMTGTRSVLPVFALSLVFDLFAIRRQMMRGAMQLTVRSAATVGVIALVAFGTIGHELARPIAARVDYTMSELEAALDDEGQASAARTGEKDLMGLSIRFVLWERAVSLIATSPLIGSGGARSMQEIRQAIPAEERAIFRPFNHVHNFILDELRLRGLVGLLLMLGFFAATTVKLFRRGSPAVREATVLFVASLVLYGSLHGLLLADRNMALIAIFLSMLLLHLKKEDFWSRVRGNGQPRIA